MPRTNSYTLTLTGSAQNLRDALSLSGVSARARQIWLQPNGDNADPVYVGSSSAVTSSSYGVRLEPGDEDGVPPAPWPTSFQSDRWQSTGDIYVIGTNAEKLHVLLVDQPADDGQVSRQR